MITPRENLQRVYAHEMPEYMPVWKDFDICFPAGLDFINERPEVPEGVHFDWFGQSWTYEPNIGAANPTPGNHLVTDITLWKEQMHFPDVERLDWEEHAEKDTANWDRKNRMSRVTIGFGPWERLFSVMDFTEALASLAEEPEACYDFFGAIADHKIRLHEQVIRYYRPDVLCMHDDYGNSLSMFMSPDTWRALIKPHLKRIVEHVQSHGVIYEHHNCGMFEPIAEDMIEIGIGATNLVYPGNDLKLLKEKYAKRMVLHGGFDRQFIDNPGTTEEQIRSTIRDTFSILAPGGNYIPGFYLGYRKEMYPVIQDEVEKCVPLYYGKRPD